MDQPPELQNPARRLVLLLICLSLAGCGIASAAGGDFSAVLGSGSPHLGISDPRCEAVDRECRIIAEVPYQACCQECTIKHWNKGDLIGQLFCEDWCETHVFTEEYKSCMSDAYCWGHS
jgi:hypothetical protein